ncbi:MAG TPA: methyltransferase domain-containing protein [Acidimicrobiales bacterium]|nr:methyltransferase domain-containing protein [Acidimicrobiales bacterium]
MRSAVAGAGARPDDDAGRALAAYDDLGRGDRFHVAVRWRSCPFPAVDARVPRAGRVLDVGCGHGLFTLYLAARSPARSVVGVDVDGDKLVSARHAAERSGLPVGFAPSVAGELPVGPWDAVTIVDVLYLLGRRPALDLVAQAAAALAPGGSLLVKEIDVRPRWKFELARLQEVVSTRVTRITEGSGVAFVPPDDIAGAMAAAGLVVTRHPLGRRSLHPHLLLVGRRPPAREGDT